MKRAGLPYDVKSTFDAAGLFVGASIACVLLDALFWFPY